MVRLLKIILLLNFLVAPLFAEKVVFVEILGDEGVLPRIEIGTTLGSEFNLEVIRKDIKRLYSTGRYEYVEAITSPIEGGIKVIFVLKRRCMLKKIAITGNSAVDAKDISEKLTLKEGELLDKFQLWKSVKAIRSLYQEKDHPLVKVEPEVITYPNSETCSVVFHIKELENIYIARINFAGNSHFDDKTLLKVLSISPRGPMGWLTSSGIYDAEN